MNDGSVPQLKSVMNFYYFFFKYIFCLFVTIKPAKLIYISNN